MKKSLSIIEENIDKIDNINKAIEMRDRIIATSKELITSSDISETAKISLRRIIEVVRSKGLTCKLDIDDNGKTIAGINDSDGIKYFVGSTKAQEVDAKMDIIVKDANSIEKFLGIADKEIIGFNIVKLEVELSAVLDKAVVLEVPNRVVQSASGKSMNLFELKSSVADVVTAVSALSSKSEKISVSMKKLSDKKYMGNAYEFHKKEDEKIIDTFSSDIIIKIPYTIKDIEKPEDLTVNYLSSSGEQKNVGGIYDAKTKSVKIRTNQFGIFIISNNKKSFSDITQEWALAYINALAAKGIINGFGNEKVNPSDQVTRAEFVTMICKTMKIEPVKSTNVFTDVDKNDWFTGFVGAGYELGLISGYVDGTFKPRNPVTREEMAAIISKILVKYMYKEPLTKSPIASQKFIDSVNINSYAVDSVSMAYKYGIIKGNNDKFLPKDKATRAESAVVIYKLMMLLYSI